MPRRYSAWTIGLLGGVSSRALRLGVGHSEASTGAIIAALLALGRSVDEIKVLCEKHVPHLMALRWSWRRTRALEKLANEVFGDARFDAFQTGRAGCATNAQERTGPAWLHRGGHRLPGFQRYRRLRWPR